MPLQTAEGEKVSPFLNTKIFSAKEGNIHYRMLRMSTDKMLRRKDLADLPEPFTAFVQKLSENGKDFKKSRTGGIFAARSAAQLQRGL